jgi:hypothetical protein
MVCPHRTSLCRQLTAGRSVAVSIFGRSSSSNFHHDSLLHAVSSVRTAGVARRLLGTTGGCWQARRLLATGDYGRRPGAVAAVRWDGRSSPRALAAAAVAATQAVLRRQHLPLLLFLPYPPMTPTPPVHPMGDHQPHQSLTPTSILDSPRLHEIPSLPVSVLVSSSSLDDSG